jgi:hypothetical protein
MSRLRTVLVISVGIILVLASGYVSSFGQSCAGGACTLANESITGGGPKVCPAHVSVSVAYSIGDPSAQCSFSCLPAGYDSTYIPDPSPGTCESSTGGVGGSGPTAVTSVAQGTFNARDCKLHNTEITVTVLNAQGQRQTYTSPTIGLWSKLNPNGSGNDCPTP